MIKYWKAVQGLLSSILLVGRTYSGMLVCFPQACLKFSAVVYIIFQLFISPNFSLKVCSLWEHLSPTNKEAFQFPEHSLFEKLQNDILWVNSAIDISCPTFPSCISLLRTSKKLQSVCPEMRYSLLLIRCIFRYFSHSLMKTSFGFLRYSWGYLFEATPRGSSNEYL